MTDLTKIEQNVYNLCLEYPQVINDPNALFDLYWHTYCGWDDSKSLYWNLQRATKPETLTRRLRALREKGLITYSKERTKVVMEAMEAEQEHAKPRKLGWF